MGITPLGAHVMNAAEISKMPAAKPAQKMACPADDFPADSDIAHPISKCRNLTPPFAFLVLPSRVFVHHRACDGFGGVTVACIKRGCQEREREREREREKGSLDSTRHGRATLEMTRLSRIVLLPLKLET
jgi:hypothetical protein